MELQRLVSLPLSVLCTLTTAEYIAYILNNDFISHGVAVFVCRLLNIFIFNEKRHNT